MSALIYQMNQDGPLGLWPLQETSGVTIKDVSGNEKHGTYSGSPVLGVKTDFMSGPSFSGANYGTIPDTAQVFANGPMTAEAWFRTTDQGWKSIFAKYNQFQNNTKWNLRLDDNEKLRPYTDSGGGSSPPFSTLAYNDGKWHHAVMTIDAARSTLLYVDTVIAAGPVTLPSNSFYLSEGSQPITIASYDGSLEYLVGQVAYCAYYQSALSADRIRAHYRAGLRGGVVVG